MKKRLIGVILLVCMALILLPVTAFAAPATSVLVGGVELTDGQYLANGDTAASAVQPVSGGYAYFHDGTLTLHDALITDMYSDGEWGMGIYTTDELNIVLENDNTINGAGWAPQISTMAILSGGNLTISGDGTLQAAPGPVFKSDSFGILSYGNLAISGNAKVVLRASDAPLSSVGAFCMGFGLLKDAASLEAYASNSQHGCSIGVAALSGFDVSGGTLKAIGGTAENVLNDDFGSHGLACLAGSIAISGGAVTAVGDESDKCSFGISAANGISLSGGSVTAQTMDDTAQSRAMDAAPDLGGYASYQWRTAAADSFSAPPYAWDAAQRYVEIKPVSAPPAANNGGDYAAPADVTVYNDSSLARSTVWLTGSGLSPSDLLLTETLTSGGDYTMMLGAAGQGDIYGSYGISLQSGRKSLNGARITFALPASYAGEIFTLVHKKADGTIETFTAIVDARGEVTFGPLYELSPFMLVRSSAISAADDAAKIPQTGDESIQMSRAIAALAAGALLTLGLVLLRFKKQR